MAGIGFTELSNGFASCEEPAALHAICDRLQPGTIEVFAQRWLHRIPMPFDSRDRNTGYWWECSMRQAGDSRTVVFDVPHRARCFFEALIADNLDLGGPENVEIVFRPPGPLRHPRAPSGPPSTAPSSTPTTRAWWSTSSTSTPASSST